MLESAAISLPAKRMIYPQKKPCGYFSMDAGLPLWRFPPE